jgi:uncharacterized NAD(P)/FAD-binding protein YdhS
VTRRLSFDVAIVGGGASGTLLAIQLLRRAPSNCRLLLVDRNGDFARGIAYRTEESSHLLNVAAARMSALPDDEGHFLDWLRKREAGVGPDTYAVRRLYGDYLHELLEASVENAAAGVRLERRQAEVRDIEEARGGVQLRFDSGEEVLARHLVLALGNAPPSPLPVSEGAAPRVWQTPWATSPAWPPLRASVLLVGSGLTAIDWVLALSAHGHQGPLHILSRHGLLPTAHHAVSPKPLELTGLPRGKLRPLVRAVRAAAAQGLGDWRSAVDALRPMTQDLWLSLGDAERRRFSRHVRTHWEAHRHRLAPAVGALVSALRAAGQLHVHAGRLLGLCATESGLEARFQPRGTKREERLAVELAINCTGPAGHSVNADALVSTLLRKGLARPGPLGLGLASDARGALLDGRGQASTRVWTLGPVRRGDAWESTAVPDIRLQAAALAEHLAPKHGGRTSRSA